ncbi:YciI family protein [Paraburkholderia hospita]|uniref:YciI family protein n=1 Tax=Paraburkholderia hospita TaxID=169430 RepID=UPI0009A5828B
MFGGFVVVSVETLEEALNWAELSPSASAGYTEVIPVLPIIRAYAPVCACIWRQACGKRRRTFPYWSDRCAACSISAATSRGWDSNTAWLAPLISTVVA